MKAFHEVSDGRHRNKNIWRVQKSFKQKEKTEKDIDHHLTNFRIEIKEKKVKRDLASV